MIFKIEITETLQRIVEVEADSLNEAINKVDDDYDDCKINLDSGDFVEYKIHEYRED